MKLRNKSKRFFPVFITVLAVVILTGLISRFYIQLLLIRGKSMEPAYHHLQLVFINKHDRNYQREDVVLIRCDSIHQNIVKRIAACPGDSVVIRDEILFVNGNAEGTGFEDVRFDYAGIAEEEILLKEKQYFVIGDNVSVSKDSRYSEIGIISEKSIRGKIVK